jgi:ubiquinone/menaquinone biosynthesis C-methylase UbiE
VRCRSRRSERRAVSLRFANGSSIWPRRVDVVEEHIGYWDAQAASFDQEPDHGLRDPAIREAWAALLRRLLPAAPSRIADLGCGTGTLSLLMAQQGHAVTGVDFSSSMINLARAKAHAASVEVDWLTGDVAAPPLADRTFDVVLTRHVLWALPDPGAALSRWLGLLGDYGHLVLIEGRWSTGAGLSASHTADLVRSHAQDSEVIPLIDEVYWGKPIDDERYVVISPPTGAAHQ